MEGGGGGVQDPPLWQGPESWDLSAQAEWGKAGGGGREHWLRGQGQGSPTRLLCDLGQVTCLPGKERMTFSFVQPGFP